MERLLPRNSGKVDEEREIMKRIAQAIENFIFPYKYLQAPEFRVSRNLMAWDSMVNTAS